MFDIYGNIMELNLLLDKADFALVSIFDDSCDNFEFFEHS
jgi:hypothetical protein